MNLISQLSDIDAITGTEIKDQFNNALPNTLMLAKVPIFDAIHAIPDLGSCCRVKRSQPIHERFTTIFVFADQNFSRSGIQAI